MENVAALGYFCIKYIEGYKLQLVLGRENLKFILSLTTKGMIQGKKPITMSPANLNQSYLQKLKRMV